MSKTVSSRLISIVLVLILSLSIGYRSALYAEGETPERGILFYSTVTSLSMGMGKRITWLEMNVTNIGTQPENIELHVLSAPPDWEIRYTKRGFGVSGLYLLPKQSQTVDLDLTSPQEAAEGKYTIVLEASTADREVQSSFRLDIELQKTEVVESIGEVSLSTSFPVLRGPTGVTFVFRIDIKNEGDEDQTFDLLPAGPRGWEVIFKPAYEEKQISSIRVPPRSSERLDVEVQPLAKTEPGEYPIFVQAISGNINDTIALKTIVIGSFELFLTMPPPGLLNLEATAGEESYVTVQLQNTGTAPLQSLSLWSTKPSEWKVVFEPNTVDIISPDSFDQVDVTIMPPSNSIPGDYSVKIWVGNNQVSESLDLRVTVSTPTIWGWVGVGIVILVVAALIFAFLWLGRR